jgi:hypothetical protein
MLGVRRVRSAREEPKKSWLQPSFYTRNAIENHSQSLASFSADFCPGASAIAIRSILPRTTFVLREDGGSRYLNLVPLSGGEWRL